MGGEQRNARDWGGRTWDDYGQFYTDVYGQHVTEMHQVGSVGTQLLAADQGEGDWSDAPTPTLVVSRLASAPTAGSFDLGAGRFAPLIGVTPAAWRRERRS